MTAIALPCKLLCASEAAYCIMTSAKSGKYNPCTNNPDVTPDMLKQYNAVGWVEDPYIATALKIEACLIGKTKTEIIISFRGTLPMAKTWESFFDWLQDLFAVPTSNVNLPGKVHSGFLFALKLLANDIVSAVEALNPNNELPVYITGHSKGGGMAPIAAMYFKNLYKMDIEQTITFAGPKPGDSEFSSAYNKVFPNDLRYENYLDIVPLLPPSNFFINELRAVTLPNRIALLLNDSKSWDYEAVGTLKYINDKGQVTSPPLPMTDRIWDIMVELVSGDVSLIVDAHHASCGYRYMQGTCGGSVCN